MKSTKVEAIEYPSQQTRSMGGLSIAKVMSFEVNDTDRYHRSGNIKYKLPTLRMNW